jgi:hypothetical protein
MKDTWPSEEQKMWQDKKLETWPSKELNTWQDRKLDSQGQISYGRDRDE